MGKLTKFVEAQQLGLDLAAEFSVDGVCPYWKDCHTRWGYSHSRRQRDGTVIEEWKPVSGKYKCAWRRDHRVALCGTYRANRREGR